MENTFVFMILLVIVLSIYPHDAFACSCMEITEQQALEKSFYSFVGVPIKIESPTSHNKIVTFQIEKTIKNIVQNITEVTIITPTQSSACGYNFENNTRYLVHTFGEKEQKTWETGLCSGNQNLGFSSIPLLADDYILTEYDSAFEYQLVLYGLGVGIILGIIIIIYKKKKC